MIHSLVQTIKKVTPTKWQWVFAHEGVKRYAKNTGWMFGGQFFSLFVSFFVGTWVARYLGPTNFGTVSYILAFVGMFGFIADLGITSTINRELVKNPDQRDELLGVGFGLKILGGSAAFIITVIGALFLSTTPLIKILVIVYSTIFISQAFNIIIVFFQAKVASQYYVYAQISAIITSSFLKIILILLGKGIIWLIVIYTLDLVWQAIGYVHIYHKLGFHMRQWKFRADLAKKIWHDSWPLMLSSAAAYIYLRIDQVLIGHMLDTKAVGYYAAAVKIAEIIYFIPGIICASLFPAIINAKKTSALLYHQRLVRLYLLLFLSAIAISLPLSLLSHWVITLLFGESFAPAAQILTIYTWSSVGLFLGTAMSQYLMAENLTKVIFAANIIAMVTNIILNLVLIPKIGLSGAALATLISYFVMPIIVFLHHKFRQTVTID